MLIIRENYLRPNINMSILKKNKFFLIIFFLISTSFFISFINIFSPKNTPTITGQWEGNINKKIIIFDLNEKNECSLKLYKSKNLLEESITGICEIDYSKDPIPVRISKASKTSFINNVTSNIICNTNCDLKPVYFIIKPIGNNKIVVSFFSKNRRLNYISFENNYYFYLFKNFNSIKKL